MTELEMIHDTLNRLTEYQNNLLHVFAHKIVNGKQIELCITGSGGYKVIINGKVVKETMQPYPSVEYYINENYQF